MKYTFEELEAIFIHSCFYTTLKKMKEASFFYCIQHLEEVKENIEFHEA